MDVLTFQEMLTDRHFPDMKKLKYKYKDAWFEEFVDILKNTYYKPLPVNNFRGTPIAYLPDYCRVNLNTAKQLLPRRRTAFDPATLAEEIIATAHIESIDFSRESVRHILQSQPPKDDEEEKILGLKQGLEFIADPDNAITEDNLYRLYQLAIGTHLEPEDLLPEGEHYRNNVVFIVGEELVHSGLDHNRLPEAMQQLLRFVHTRDNIDDLTKASILHFCIAYYHPYFDGNGRMARLLHLWYLVQQGYGSALFLPFSQFIAESKTQYGKAFELIEANEKLTGTLDVTPFIQYISSHVYDRIAETPPATSSSVDQCYEAALASGGITQKEALLWDFVRQNYGTEPFSTKRLQHDYGDAAYATIRAFVQKFEALDLLQCHPFSNRPKYQVK